MGRKETPWQELNLRPPGFHSGALSTELQGEGVGRRVQRITPLNPPPAAVPILSGRVATSRILLSFARAFGPRRANAGVLRFRNGRNEEPSAPLAAD